jgi:thiamine-monophosphate kinase
VKPEDRFVEKLRALLPRADGVLLGPGDDAALIAWPEEILAATTDLLVEGVDFLPDEDPGRVGRRAVAVNLSDLAAMGAAPAFFLLAIGFPAERGEEFPLAIVRGAIERGSEFGTHLVGGDLSAAKQAIVSVAAWGRPAPSSLTRSGARPGDVVFVSGHPGDAAAGLRLAQTIAAFSREDNAADLRFPELSAEHQQRLLAAFQDPVPRVVLGRALAVEGLATAAIDVSDGLGVDAGRLARSSGARLLLEEDRLPLSRPLISFSEMEELDPVELAVSGGDDYELLFTASPACAERLEDRPDAFGISITRIGRVVPGGGAALVSRKGEREIADLGHDHLERLR